MIRLSIFLLSILLLSFTKHYSHYRNFEGNKPGGLFYTQQSEKEGEKNNLHPGSNAKINISSQTYRPSKSVSSSSQAGTIKRSASKQQVFNNSDKPASYVKNRVNYKTLMLEPIKIDFQDAITKQPMGWKRDIGQSFRTHTGIYQGGDLVYGWKKKSDGSPLDLTANGRNRENPEDVLLASLIHMQAQDSWSSDEMNKTEGYWELKVLNGVYDITVAVGDGFDWKAPERHTINVEGVTAISRFKPMGKTGSLGRFKIARVRIFVKDGYLTIDADGGMNTKIDFAQISPVSVFPYLHWSDKTKNILIECENRAKKVFTAGLINSSGDKVDAYNISINYNRGAGSWLKLAGGRNKGSNISFDYSAAGNLPVGIYRATVKASANGFSSSEMNVQLRVTDSSRPYVVSSSPNNGSNTVDISTVSIAANNLHVPVDSGYKGGIDNSTITNSTVKLFKIADGKASNVSGVIQGTGGGDAISFSPSNQLEPNTVYKFVITSGVRSYNNTPLVPYESTFNTGLAPIDSTNILNVEFTKIPMRGTQYKGYTSLTFGPDGKFYALRLDGTIDRFTVDPETGEFSNMQVSNILVKKYGGRSAIGLAFDPKSTAADPVLWVSHSSSGLTSAPEYAGKISRISGAGLQNEQLVITKLPRSTRDHMVNGLAFGPDKALYICQGSNSSAGAFDDGWQREETLLAGAILRLDLNKLQRFKLPMDVSTSSKLSVINRAPLSSIATSDGKYNPYSTKSPLTIYASGVRNAYDIVWHSNGQMYLPANGPGGGGNSPASKRGIRRPDGTFYTGPVIPETRGVQVQNDRLFRINPLKGVGYFGHPNPLRGEYVINRGYQDNPLYPPNIKPDANYRGAAFDFGLNHSPNGAIEYKSNTFNGVLKGKILVCRFSGGGDIMVLEPGSMVKDSNLTAGIDDKKYDIVRSSAGSGNFGMTGMSGFANPLDIIEDTRNGNLYISEYNWNDNPNLISQITLLRVKESEAQLNAHISKQKRDLR